MDRSSCIMYVLGVSKKCFFFWEFSKYCLTSASARLPLVIRKWPANSSRVYTYVHLYTLFWQQISCCDINVKWDRGFRLRLMIVKKHDILRTPCMYNQVVPAPPLSIIIQRGMGGGDFLQNIKQRIRLYVCWREYNSYFFLFHPTWKKRKIGDADPLCRCDEQT